MLTDKAVGCFIKKKKEKDVLEYRGNENRALASNPLKQLYLFLRSFAVGSFMILGNHGCIQELQADSMFMLLRFLKHLSGTKPEGKKNIYHRNSILEICL